MAINNILNTLDEVKTAIEMVDTDARALAENCDTLQKQRDSLLEALEALLEIHPQPGESPNESFERVGEAFMRDTGMLRPGKDQGYITTPTHDERNAAFSQWWEAKVSKAAAVVSKARGQA